MSQKKKPVNLLFCSWECLSWSTLVLASRIWLDFDAVCCPCEYEFILMLLDNRFAGGGGGAGGGVDDKAAGAWRIWCVFYNVKHLRIFFKYSNIFTNYALSHEVYLSNSNPTKIFLRLAFSTNKFILRKSYFTRNMVAESAIWKIIFKDYYVYNAIAIYNKSEQC